MNYAKYKSIRDGAWQCLIDCNVTALPVPIGMMSAHYGLRIVHNSEVPILHIGESGRLVIGKRPAIVVRDTEPAQRLRFTIAHELAHYLLGHLGDDISSLSRSNVRYPQEQEADMFAARLLMPACVLWALDLHTPEDIAINCNVSLSAATARAQRMEVLYRRNAFLTSPAERQFYQQMHDFIVQKTKLL